MKTSLLKARVSPEMKRALKRIADARGESESVIVREAIYEYVRAMKEQGKGGSTSHSKVA